MNDEEFEAALRVVRDMAIERGAELSDVSSAFEKLRAAIVTGPRKRLLLMAPPAELTDEAAHRWCEEHGGHTISGFAEFWRCTRCNLSGHD